MTPDAEIRAHLAEMDEGLAKSDAKRLAKTYSPEATLVGPGAPPFHGVDAIEKFYENFFIDFPRASDTIYKTDVKEISVNGDLASVLASFSSTSQGKTTKGHFLLVLKRLADGKWYTHHDIFSLEI